MQGKDYTFADCFRKGFTLAEVLITLGIIGVVAAMTIPTLISKYQEKVLLEEFKVAYSTIQQFLVKVQADWGNCPDCFYWDKTPYGPTKCEKYSDSGRWCIKSTLEDGSPVPDDYMARTVDCPNLINEVSKQLQVVKFCDGNALKDGCLSDMKGYDKILKEQQPDKSDDDIADASVGCGSFKQKYLEQYAKVFVLKNGITIIPYGYKTPLMLVDINGQKGPNKWGYDIYTLQITGSMAQPPNIKGGICMVVEKGGNHTNKMIQNIHRK